MLQSFILGILVSYLQRRIKCVFKNCRYPESWRGGAKPPPPRGARGAPLRPLPSAGRGGGNQSCNWHRVPLGNMIPVRSKRSLREGQRSHPEEPPSGATLRSHLQDPTSGAKEPPSGATLRSHPQEPPSGATLRSQGSTLRSQGATLRSQGATLRSHPRVAPEGVKVTALY